MERRPLGESGLEVSPLALGTWAMGGYAPTWGYVDDRESVAAIHQALDCGINLIDTAPIYGLGHAEEIVGRAILGRRDEVVIATKCGLQFPETPDLIPPRCLRRDHVIRECEASLRRLRTDVIDVMQCHWPDPQTPIEETIEALGMLIEQGKIRAMGLSNFDYEQVRAARKLGPIACIQPPLSPLNQRAAEDLIPYCMEHRIGVITYSPLAKGLLTGKFDANSRFGDLRASDPEFIGKRFSANLSFVESLKPIAVKYDRSLAQLALNWSINHFGVTAPIFGAKKPSQVTENAGAMGWTISEEDRAEIDHLAKEHLSGA